MGTTGRGPGERGLVKTVAPAAAAPPITGGIEETGAVGKEVSVDRVEGG
jgi:hypothetical protein